MLRSERDGKILSVHHMNGAHVTSVQLTYGCNLLILLLRYLRHADGFLTKRFLTLLPPFRFSHFFSEREGKGTLWQHCGDRWWVGISQGRDSRCHWAEHGWLGWMVAVRITRPQRNLSRKSPQSHRLWNWLLHAIAARITMLHIHEYVRVDINVF